MRPEASQLNKCNFLFWFCFKDFKTEKLKSRGVLETSLHCCRDSKRQRQRQDNPHFSRTYGATLNYFVNFLCYQCPENLITAVAKMKCDTGEWNK